MAFKNKLLATAAIPLIVLMGMGPAFATGLPQTVAPAEAQSLVIKVQSDDDEQLKQKKRERRENQNKAKQNDQGDQDNGGKRRKKADDAGNQSQQDDQQQVKPRRKKADDAANQMQQDDQQQVKPRRKKADDAADQTQQDDQQQVKPRRKKADDAANQMQQDDQQQVKPRRKKADDAATDQTQQDDQQQVKPRRKKADDTADQTQQDDQDQVKPRRKKADDTATDQTQQDDQQQVKPRRKKADDATTDQTQQDDQDQVKPRRKKADQDQSDDDAIKNALDKNRKNKDKNKQDNASTDDNGNVRPRRNGRDKADDNSAIEKIETLKKDDKNDDVEKQRRRERRQRDNPVDVKRAKDIADDPSKTTDTVVLPIENGAAVLDSDKDADNRGDAKTRERRKREREDVKPVRVPKSDRDAQVGFREDKRTRIRPVLEDRGERLDDFRGYDVDGGHRLDDRGNRFVVNIGGDIVIRTDDDTRIARNTEIIRERLPNGLIRETVKRPDGSRVVTVRNRYGELVRRSKVSRDGDRETVIFYSPELEEGRDKLYLRDPGADLPPMRLSVPVKDYIIDVSSDRDRNYEKFLDQPPVEPVERVYTVDEVKNSARIRDKMRRIDLDTITFDTGSSDISDDQADSLKQVGSAIRDILAKDPGETFMIEGHTDAVGSDESNLVLSDSRAEAVANVLSDAFGIPAENLVTQGYGERFLKIDSDGPVRENRRVTIRRITPLVRPLASNQE